ncbi:UDP-N-acetylmuramate--L-alanine ligase [Paraconexibacter sp. AEG42_29]|uniref:UDP-N-acetylmuramate--L-alanine ligase n=1 Tax=Paraconexibacter sp. AEG42_29 TaxID=2997339 RepID=A0AAU7AVD3_9ACTN
MTGQAPWAGQRLHLVGIGGAGMSAYARCAVALGATVSGSDQAESPGLAALRALGIDARAGHVAANVPAGEGVEVFHSTAIPPSNPERTEAARRGLADHPRAELLRRFSALKRTIAVAGAHGKTTTTSMIAHALLALDAAPAYLIGGDLVSTGRNGEWGTGEWLVVEADESDGSFLSIDADIAVVTNVELDHHATYPSLEALRGVFRTFLATPTHAVLWDRPDVLALRPAGAPVVPFDAPAEPLELLVPGDHNQRNAAAALAALTLAGFDPAAVRAALATFPGAGRRFQTLGTTRSGARIVDDYAHHPTEVAATIQAARSLAPRRVVAVFQAHLFSRTMHLAGRFGAALAGADVACLVDVYPARERQEDFPQITGRLLVQTTLDARPGMPVFWLPAFDDVERALAPLLRDGDLVLVMGAGDVNRLGARLAAG